MKAKTLVVACKFFDKPKNSLVDDIVSNSVTAWQKTEGVADEYLISVSWSLDEKQTVFSGQGDVEFCLTINIAYSS